MISLFLLWALNAAHAQVGIEDTAAPAPEQRSTQLAPVQVFGSGTQFLSRPMTPAKVDKYKMETYQFTDVGRALKQAPGVYTRDEDGQGLRPNIGLRGTNPDRSKKITLMEDGVLIGPAPYSAPAAYYTPSVIHTESMEVFKGFAGLPFGPNSVGGAVNYITTEIPSEAGVKATFTGGAFETRQAKVSAGSPTPFGGYLLEGSHLRTNGFKKLDGGGDTGFKHNSLLGKIRFDLPGAGHNLQLTSSYSDEDSHETYVGLSDEDFDSTPYRRYSSTANDRMRWQHSKFQLRHQLPVGETGAIETTAYHHRFHRAWYRLDRFRNTSVNLRDILRDPTGANAPYYSILRGDADSSTLGATDGQLVVVNNDRSYISQGIQSRASYILGAHSLELFARYHMDEIDRNHTSDRYEMVSGRTLRTADPTQTDTLNTDRARALSISLQDNWDVGALTFTPVVRWESAEFDFKDDISGNKRSRRDEVWLPGLGVTRRIGEYHSVRASVNRAATLAGISIDGSERREEATNYEVEYKYAESPRSQEASVTFFYNDYQNITGTCSASGGCTLGQFDEIFNGGKAVVQGLELRAAKGFYAGPVHMPVQLTYTLIEAEFRNDFASNAPDWGIGNVQSGDPLPYVPRTQLSFSFGTEYGSWKQDLTLTHQSASFDQATAGRKEIPAYGIVDWVGAYYFTRTNKLTLKADNLLGREYIASARPYGLRPGKPRTIQLAWTCQF